MPELTASDFSVYFKDTHGHEPFPWQQRLTTEVLERGSWPDVIDLPTGTGKTAVLDTALFALAAQPKIFSRRIVFVIDRRIVVDQVYERAERIEEAIRKGETGVLQVLREKLAAVGGDDQSLGVVALRGGIPVDAEWAKRPDQPWVLVSTVDQFGSRLLFRGYGVGPRMRPIHAGLAGNDCLVILDEVHLSRPFADTLRAAAELDSEPAGLLPRRFHVVEMSATPQASDSDWRFELTEPDLASSEELRRRVYAAKAANVVDAGSKQPHEALPAKVKSILKSELDDTVRSVGVIVNRVRTARDTHLALLEAGYASHLITGRMRPLDREHSMSAIEHLVDPERQTAPEELNVVVATQAIEVGADFSFDALITEVAPIDSLRQRFGRLDRRGSLAHKTSAPAKAWILGARSTLNPKRPDPVYEDSARVTWEELQRLDENGPVDFSPRPETPHEFTGDAYAPFTQAPLLLSSYLDAWVQTNPEPVAQPGVEWFLHGIETEKRADVTLAWRYDRSQVGLKEVPLRPAEYLQVPIGAARAWLSGATEVPVADVGGGEEAVEAKPKDDQEQKTAWVRWQGHDEEPERISHSEIRPGDVLVVDPLLGGLSEGTWDPDSEEAVEDLGDAAQHAYRQRFTLRLDSRVLNTLGNLPQAYPSPAQESEAETPLRERIDDWLQALAETSGLEEWVKEVAEGLRLGYEVKLVSQGDAASEERGHYILASRRIDPSILEGSDTLGSFTGSGVTLNEHLEGVGERAALYAQRLGLPEDVQSDLKLAARLHDLGKVDSRFQSQMVGGDPVEMARRNEPLAKSIPGASPKRGGWPPVRHEIMSVALAQSNPEVLAEAHDPDLVLHLVETHHGYARPLPPIRVDGVPELLEYEHEGKKMQASTDLCDGPLALEMAERFWRLNRRYGRHGLAWLEAILRLADHQQSAEEEQRR